MGTFIEAVVFDGDPGTAAVPPGLRMVPLGAGLSMLPVTSDLLARVDPAAVGDERIPRAGCYGSPWRR